MQILSRTAGTFHAQSTKQSSKLSQKKFAETSEFIVRQIRPHIWPKIFTWTYKPQFGKAFTKLQILYIWSVSAIMGFLMLLYVLWNLYLYAYGI